MTTSETVEVPTASLENGETTEIAHVSQISRGRIVPTSLGVVVIGALGERRSRNRTRTRTTASTSSTAQVLVFLVLILKDV